MVWLILIVMVVLAVFVLKGFDVIAGRGPKQVSDGIKRSNIAADKGRRVPCPECAELILAAARKCPFCKSEVTP